MTIEKLRSMIRSRQVSEQLVNLLPRMPDGVQSLAVNIGNGKTVSLRAVRLQRVGNKLRRTSRMDREDTN